MRPGDRIGRLTLLNPIRMNGRAGWICRCDCGRQVQVRADSLRTEHTTSCGCVARERLALGAVARFNDLSGKRFGRLKVLEFWGRWHKRMYYLCRCDCGTEKIITAYSLTHRLTASCGCYRNDQIKKAAKRRKRMGHVQYRQITSLHAVPDKGQGRVQLHRTIRTKYGTADSANLGWMTADDYKAFIESEHERLHAPEMTLMERFGFKIDE